MDRLAAAWVVVVILSIGAFGVASATLETTLTTDPDDVIDLDYDRLPIGQGDAATLKEEIEGDTDGDPDDERSPEPSEDDGEEMTEPEGNGDDDGSSLADGIGMGTSPTESTLWDRLLALLGLLLRMVLYLAVAVGAITAVVRYRDRLWALIADPGRGDGVEGATVATAEWPPDDPANPIEREWVRLVRRLDVDNPEQITATECARVAIDAGYDRDAVETLTETFEAVQYGGRPVTPERVQIACRCGRRLLDGGAP